MLEVLKQRFLQNMQRHSGLQWEDVVRRLESNAQAVAVLRRMEDTGGEPDVIGYDGERFLFCDCAAESPAGRRSLCYDETALKSRKKNPPLGSVEMQARQVGVELLTEEQYRGLQLLGTFDRKTSSWVATPEEIRGLGGALFCERRYGAVFTFHNGADSYYAARGWRGLLKV